VTGCLCTQITKWEMKQLWPVFRYYHYIHLVRLKKFVRKASGLTKKHMGMYQCITIWATC